MIELLAFGATLVRVFARAFQQLNVTRGHYLPIIPTSYVMGFLEVIIVSLIVMEGFSWPLVFAIGTGGWTGAILAMCLHSRIFGKERKRAGREAKEYIESIGTLANSPTRSGAKGVVKYYKTDQNEIYRALSALWKQVNGR